MSGIIEQALRHCGLEPTADLQHDAEALAREVMLLADATASYLQVVSAKTQRESELLRQIRGYEQLVGAARPFAELGTDLTDQLCHYGLCEPRACGRCSKVIALREALVPPFDPRGRTDGS